MPEQTVHYQERMARQIEAGCDGYCALDECVCPDGDLSDLHKFDSTEEAIKWLTT